MTKRSILISGCAVAIIVCISLFIFLNYHTNASGTYLNQDRKGVRMLQLVEAKDGKLSGQIESVALNDAGKIVNISASVDGIRDGENISLSLKILSSQPIPVTASGTYHQNSITLTMGVLGKEPKIRVYKRSDANAFQSAKDDFKKDFE